MRKQHFWAVSLLALLFACAPVISKQSLREADESLTFQELIKDPERSKGKLMLLGGEIISNTVKEDETWMEVLQQPLDWQLKPKDTDLSHGRFLVHLAEFRDPAVYAPGRKITVLGKVQGKKILPLQEIMYSYPVLTAREIHLWKPETWGGPFFHFGIEVGGMIR